MPLSEEWPLFCQDPSPDTVISDTFLLSLTCNSPSAWKKPELIYSILYWDISYLFMSFREVLLHFITQLFSRKWDFFDKKHHTKKIHNSAKNSAKKQKSCWKLMIFFCYFCNKKMFLFWAWPKSTPFLPKLGPKIAIISGFYQPFLRFTDWIP